MQRGIGGGELEPAEEQHDTELTLGPMMLAGLVLGLLVLCGLCFGLGYAAGRRGAAQQAAKGAQMPASVAMPAAAAASGAKPAATTPNPYQAPPAAVAGEPDETPAADGGALAELQGAVPAAPSNPSTMQQQVRPALPQAQSGALPGAAAVGSAAATRAATQPQGPLLMVQVAAVSHAEDAGVLVNALRKRGYAAMARHDAADGLIHVQVGPFTNRSDAVAMSQRLLGDGYNAMVVP